MEVTGGQTDRLKQVLIVLVVAFVLVFGPTLVFLIRGDEVPAAVMGTFTVGLILAITHVGAFAAGTLYTRGTMQMGGELVLRAQESDDRRDAKEFAIAGRLFSEGARAGRQVGQADIPALPLPSQGMDWLPQVTVLQDDEDAWHEKSGMDGTTW